MRSLVRTDSAVGLCVAVVLVAAMVFVAQVTNRHAKEHGHCPPFAMFDMEGAQRGDGKAGGEGEDGGHGCIVPATEADKHVRGGRP